MNKHKTMVDRVELMSLSVASIENKTCLVLTMRFDSNKFESNNIAITAEQAIRLRQDLDHVFKTSESMKKAVNEYSDSKKSFEKIIFG